MSYARIRCSSCMRFYDEQDADKCPICYVAKANFEVVVEDVELGDICKSMGRTLEIQHQRLADLLNSPNGRLNPQYLKDLNALARSMSHVTESGRKYQESERVESAKLSKADKIRLFIEYAASLSKRDQRKLSMALSRLCNGDDLNAVFAFLEASA